MDGDREDRIEMLAIRGNDVTHLKTLAILKQEGNRITQMDSYITDIDGNSYLDLVTIERNRMGEIGKKAVYVMERDNRRWKETTELDAPWTSIELYDPKM